ncbi:MAG: hypothetical protein IJ833_02320 [Lachnospiraceae bacterium]|nr:hypothetical protein [Lachnospiraceae bacterium]
MKQIIKIIIFVLVSISVIFFITNKGNLLSYCDNELKNVYSHHNTPTAVRHYIGDENGHKVYESKDSELICSFMSALKNIQVSEKTDGLHYNIDVITFIMDDNQRYDVTFNDKRLYVYIGESVNLYNIKREETLWELFKIIDQEENLVSE